jgi:hypothetical protein
MNTDLIRDYASLAQQRRDLKSKLDDVNRKLAEMRPVVCTELTNEGIDKMPVKLTDGRGLTLSLVRIVRAHLKESCPDRSTAIDALEQCGLDRLLRVDFNLNSVSSWMREELAAGRKLDARLRAVFDISDTPDLRATVRRKSETPSSLASDTMSTGGAFEGAGPTGL